MENVFAVAIGNSHSSSPSVFSNTNETHFRPFGHSSEGNCLYKYNNKKHTYKNT